MIKTEWNPKFMPTWLPSQCEQMGVCQCEKNDVRCGNQKMGVDYQKENAKEYAEKEEAL